MNQPEPKRQRTAPARLRAAPQQIFHAHVEDRRCDQRLRDARGKIHPIQRRQCERERLPKRETRNHSRARAEPRVPRQQREQKQPMLITRPDVLYAKPRKRSDHWILTQSCRDQRSRPQLLK